MENTLKIALVQTDIVWQNASQNRIRYSEKINSINGAVDIVVLPEMFSTGFSMHPVGIAETMQGETVQWMRNFALEKNTAICGSLIISEGENYYNRFLFVHPSGEITYYDKRHLFSLAGEEKVYTRGNDKLLIDFKGWKICPLICYDLRFPVWARNTENYDVLLYVANWPKPRILAWDTLLKARSIENMCYVIGVNRVGEDENGYEFNGHSAAYDGLGGQLTNNISAEECVQVVSLNKESLLEVRKKLNFLNDKDIFEILD